MVFLRLLAFVDSLFLTDRILPAQKRLMCGSVLGHSNGYRDTTLARKGQVLPKGGNTDSESGSPLWVRVQQVIYCSPLGRKRSPNV